MSQPGTILIVDDEPAVRRSSARLLERAGHETHTAASAPEALEFLREGTSVDVVVSDVVMPEMTGIEFAEAAREVVPGVEIVLFSAFTPAALARHKLDDGKGHFILQKPVERAELLEQVRLALERARRS